MLLEKISQLACGLIIILTNQGLAIAFLYFCQIGMYPAPLRIAIYSEDNFCIKKHLYQVIFAKAKL
jgi:hypothetical protein